MAADVAPPEAQEEAALAAGFKDGTQAQSRLSHDACERMAINLVTALRARDVDVRVPLRPRTVVTPDVHVVADHARSDAAAAPTPSGSGASRKEEIKLIRRRLRSEKDKLETAHKQLSKYEKQLAELEPRFDGTNLHELRALLTTEVSVVKEQALAESNKKKAERDEKQLELKRRKLWNRFLGHYIRVRNESSGEWRLSFALSSDERAGTLKFYYGEAEQTEDIDTRSLEKMDASGQIEVLVEDQDVSMWTKVPIKSKGKGRNEYELGGHEDRRKQQRLQEQRKMQRHRHRERLKEKKLMMMAKTPTGEDGDNVDDEQKDENDKLHSSAPGREKDIAADEGRDGSMQQQPSGQRQKETGGSVNDRSVNDRAIEGIEKKNKKVKIKMKHSAPPTQPPSQQQEAQTQVKKIEKPEAPAGESSGPTAKTHAVSLRSRFDKRQVSVYWEGKRFAAIVYFDVGDANVPVLLHYPETGEEEVLGTADFEAMEKSGEVVLLDTDAAATGGSARDRVVNDAGTDTDDTKGKKGKNTKQKDKKDKKDKTVPAFHKEHSQKRSREAIPFDVQDILALGPSAIGMKCAIVTEADGEEVIATITSIDANLGCFYVNPNDGGIGTNMRVDDQSVREVRLLEESSRRR